MMRLRRLRPSQQLLRPLRQMGLLLHQRRQQQQQTAVLARMQQLPHKQRATVRRRGPAQGKGRQAKWMLQLRLLSAKRLLARATLQ